MVSGFVCVVCEAMMILLFHVLLVKKKAFKKSKAELIIFF